MRSTRLTIPVPVHPDFQVPLLDVVGRASIASYHVFSPATVIGPLIALLHAQGGPRLLMPWVDFGTSDLNNRVPDGWPQPHTSSVVLYAAVLHEIDGVVRTLRDEGLVGDCSRRRIITALIMWAASLDPMPPLTPSPPGP